jgi:hypothetical protein
MEFTCPLLDNPHASTETHFQICFSVNIWFGIIGKQLIGLFVLEDRLTSENYLHFLEGEWPVLLDVPLHMR